MQTYKALYIGSLPVPRAMGKCYWPCHSWEVPETHPQLCLGAEQSLPLGLPGSTLPALCLQLGQGLMGWGLPIPRDGCAEQGH